MAKNAETNALIEAKKTIQAGITFRSTQIAEKRALVAGYQAEISALTKAPISFDDYANFVRLNMRAQAASILDGFSERVLGSTAGRVPMNKKSWAYFEEPGEAAPFVWQDSFTPETLGGIHPWTLLCFLGGEKFEDGVIDKLRALNASRWGNQDAMPVQQRRARVTELQALVDKETAELDVLCAELDELTDGI